MDLRLTDKIMLALFSPALLFMFWVLWHLIRERRR